MGLRSKVPIKVIKKSGFDKSHHNALTTKVGTITPVLVDELIPGSKVNLRFALAGSLPPLAVDTYMKCFFDVRAFFVPFRLLAGGFESWFSDYSYNVVTNEDNSGNVIYSEKGFLPRLAVDSSADMSSIFGPGSLSDYLGYKMSGLGAGYDEDIILSLLPFLAYHRVCNDWFRQGNITREYFARPSTSLYNTVFLTGSSEYAAAFCPFVSFTNIGDCTLSVSGDINDDNLKLADGVSVLSLRQANYDYDYFTNALPSAQLGNQMTVNSVNSFSIPSLRLANALQQFSELNMMAGQDLVSVVKARYGANLSRGVAQRCIYLGGSRLDIASKSVDVTAQSNVSSQNPFIGSVGASAGKAYIQGSDLIVDGFEASEPGYLFVVGVLIPKVTYGSGIRRYLTHYTMPGSLVDMATPLLQNIGNQPVYAYELSSCLGYSSYSGDIFGYTDRYAEFMTMEDEVHGLMIRGNSLDAFVAQRYFYENSQPSINSAFLAISTQALYNVTAVANQISNFGFYGQFAFDYKVAQPLAQYCQPSLQNPAYEHGKTIMLHRGGFRF